MLEVLERRDQDVEGMRWHRNGNAAETVQVIFSTTDSRQSIPANVKFIGKSKVWNDFKRYQHSDLTHHFN
jgi:hypothetical protein